jgi:ParB family chromosome partitioning protein
MARKSKKKAVTVATVAEAATDAEIRNAGRSGGGSRCSGRDGPGNGSGRPASGETVFIPLNKLKKSPRNARKTPHTEAEIEA